MHIGKKIRVARVVKGMTQEDLAEKIGKTRPLISQIESTGKVKVGTLKQICKVLDMDPEDPDLTSFFEENEIYLSGASKQKQRAKDFAIMERELKMLRELVESQKALIDELKKKLGRK
ncbi:MAG TPA: helix-turn-helix transcriptional regulator [Bacteroidia bacterium]|nr:helix-turn-helix transcriptional regulator [Bacteroidia bacterium]